MTDSAHDTLGRHFRTPAHPDVLTALGRSIYNFLSLEESVVAILYDAEFAPLNVTRARMAGAKEHQLRSLAKRYRKSTNGSAVAPILVEAADAFHAALAQVRNRVSHSQPYTAGTDEHGEYLPGLAYTADNGSSQVIVEKPSDLLDLAEQIEEAIDALSAARAAVAQLPTSQLT